MLMFLSLNDDSTKTPLEHEYLCYMHGKGRNGSNSMPL
jgi:hypothetical protein